MEVAYVWRDGRYRAPSRDPNVATANALALLAATKATQASRKRIDIVNTHTYTLGMDVYFVLNGITFVWNEEKARKNPGKHDGVSFQQAAEAFFDPFLTVVDASRNDEARDALIGMDRRWNLLYVVHIEFDDDDVIRIISARMSDAQGTQHPKWQQRGANLPLLSQHEELSRYERQRFEQYLSYQLGCTRDNDG